MDSYFHAILYSVQVGSSTSLAFASGNIWPVVSNTVSISSLNYHQNCHIGRFVSRVHTSLPIISDPKVVAVMQKYIISSLAEFSILNTNMELHIAFVITCIFILKSKQIETVL